MKKTICDFCFSKPKESDEIFYSASLKGEDFDCCKECRRKLIKIFRRIKLKWNMKAKTENQNLSSSKKMKNPFLVVITIWLICFFVVLYACFKVGVL